MLRAGGPKTQEIATMTSPPRSLLLLVAAVLCVAAAAGGIVACGADDGVAASQDVEQLLQDTFAGDKQVDSGRIDFALHIDAKGAQGAGGPVDLELAGPFETQGEGRLPKFKLDLAFEGRGQSVKAGATSTGDEGFVNFQGQDYAIPTPLFRQFQAGFEEAQARGSARPGQSLATLGIDPRRWLTNARNAGEATVGDAETIRITGDVDVARLLDDLAGALEQAQALGAQRAPRLTEDDRRRAARALGDVEVEIHTGKDDRILRRIAVSSGGAAGLTLDLSLVELNEDQDIAAPENAEPFEQLLGRFRTTP
jgi:hypothetical protein